jgi:hypothetical protein
MKQITVNDAVRVIKDGRAGIVARMSETNSRAGVQFVQNGPVIFFLVRNLRRMTLKEIGDSPISGVGCNQAMEL